MKCKIQSSAVYKREGLQVKMGVFLSSFLFGTRKAQILILGLDAGGKTTILYRLKTGVGAITVPTIGFNAEEIKYGNLSFVAFDIGGQDRIRKMWPHYFPKTDGVVFVVDSADRNRINLAKKELDLLHAHPMLNNIPFLIFANKQDISTAMKQEELCRALNMFTYKDRVWKVQPSIGTDGTGVQEGFTWLSKNI